jgi:hypothetical protein
MMRRETCLPFSPAFRWAQVAEFQSNLRCAAQHLFWSSLYGSVFGEDGRFDAFETLVQVRACKVMRMRKSRLHVFHVHEKPALAREGSLPTRLVMGVTRSSLLRCPLRRSCACARCTPLWGRRSTATWMRASRRSCAARTRGQRQRRRAQAAETGRAAQGRPAERLRAWAPADFSTWRSLGCRRSC